MVKCHSSPGRLSGDSILLAVHPALGLASRSPRIPPLRPRDLSGQVRRSSNWLPLAESGEEGWARGPKEGRRGVRLGRDRERGKRQEWWKKKIPGWEKSDGPRRETS